jgi:hypothetical protein
LQHAALATPAFGREKRVLPRLAASEHGGLPASKAPLSRSIRPDLPRSDGDPVGRWPGRSTKGMEVKKSFDIGVFQPVFRSAPTNIRE